ncbi:MULTISPECIES: rod shape-determining protein MreC [Protofrankia]|uniref:Cell shape-determining protein MreC n=1 Tax=Protofrankia coriariae TaxID=1562887 RepID=A0ABR5F475_9ACTN|nr:MULTISPECIES: rod shape-determining protein MreC [Protofrankia]KLL11513.1 rod shape-determining protein MreC [Protofrankia coriariae]ONH35637.1 rod shape-determining protein MreC [Protofrankia sp. BMG5.30]
MGRDTRRSRMIIIVLLVVAFTLITIDYRSSERSSGVRGALREAFGGVEGAVSTVTRPIGRTLSALAHPNRYQKRADALAAENAELRRRLAEDEEVRRQAAALSSLRLLADRGEYTIIPARVVAIGDITGTDWTVTINAGSADGIAPDRLVINNDGLVGTVLTATAHTAVVRLVSSPASHVGARLENTRLLGAVTGRGTSGSLTFTLYDATLQVKTGDRLVTFGSVDYAGGVPIGVVTKVLDSGGGLSHSAEVTTFAALGSLDLVGVVVGRPATDPGDRLLPPRPIPPPTAAPPAATPSRPPATASPSPGLPVRISPTATLAPAARTSTG